MSDKSLRTVFGGSTLLFVGMAVQLGFGFAARTAAARYLGSADYGAIALGITIVTFFPTVVLLGTDTGIAQFLPRFDDERSRRGTLLSAFGLTFPLAVVGGGTFVLFPEAVASTLGTPQASGVLQVFGAIIPFAALLQLSISGTRGMQLATPRVYIQDITLPMARLGLIVVVVVLGGSAIDIAYAYLVAYGVAAVLAFGYLARYSSLLVSDVSPKPMARSLLAFSAPLVVSALSYRLFTNIDVFLLSFFTGTTESVGIYQAVYPLSRLLSVFLGPFTFMIMPVLSELDSDDNYVEMRRIYRTAVKWIVVLTLPLYLLFLTFPEVVIRNSFGMEYTVGSSTLVVLSLAFLSHSVVGPNTEALTSVGASKLVMVDHVAVAGANVVLNSVLIPRYSYFGAGVATAISFALLNLLVTYQLYRRSGIQPVSKPVVQISSVSVLVFAALVWATTRPLGFEGLQAALVTALSFAVVYMVVVFRFGIGKEELTLFESLEDRLGLELHWFKRRLRRAVRED